MMLPAKPLFPWVGGKTKLAPLIRPLLNVEHRRWVEPFAGGLGLLLLSRNVCSKTLLGDANPELIDAYTTVRDETEAVIMELLALPVSAEDYYHQRDDVDPQQLGAAQRAARFIYLQSLAYNGLQRRNPAGRSTAAYGAKDGWRPDVRNLRSVAERLRGARLVAGDFEALVNSAAEGDLVLCDPPYVDTFTGYTGEGFTLADQERLAAALKRAAERGAKVLAFNVDTPEVRDLYAGFRFVELPIRRNLAAKSSARGLAKEVAIMSYEPGQFAAKTTCVPSTAAQVAAKEAQESQPKKGGRLTDAEAKQRTEFVRQLLESGLQRAEILPAFRERFGGSTRTCDEHIKHAKNSWAIEATVPTAEDRSQARDSFLEKLEQDVKDLKAAGVLAPLPALRRLEAEVRGLRQIVPNPQNNQAQPPGVTVNVVNVTPEQREHNLRLLKRVIEQRENPVQADDEADEITTTGESAPPAA